MSEASFTAVEFKGDKIAKVDPKEKCCISCHYEGRGRFPGSYWFYPPLFFFGVVPGLLYWLYRTCSGQSRCWQCGKATLVPASSAMGIAIHNENLDRARAFEKRESKPVDASQPGYGDVLELLNKLDHVKGVQVVRMFLPKNCSIATATIKPVNPDFVVVDQVPFEGRQPLTPPFFVRLASPTLIEARFDPKDAGKEVRIFVAEFTRLP